MLWPQRGHSASQWPSVPGSPGSLALREGWRKQLPPPPLPPRASRLRARLGSPGLRVGETLFLTVSTGAWEAQGHCPRNEICTVPGQILPSCQISAWPLGKASGVPSLICSAVTPAPALVRGALGRHPACTNFRGTSPQSPAGLRCGPGWEAKAVYGATTHSPPGHHPLFCTPRHPQGLELWWHRCRRGPRADACF